MRISTYVYSFHRQLSSDLLLCTANYEGCLSGTGLLIGLMRAVKHIIKVYGKEALSMHSSTWPQLVVSCEVIARKTLSPGEKPAVPLDRRLFGTQSVWAQWRRGKKSKPDSAVVQYIDSHY
jgi:hypothetical protein